MLKRISTAALVVAIGGSVVGVAVPATSTAAETVNPIAYREIVLANFPRGMAMNGSGAKIYTADSDPGPGPGTPKYTMSIVDTVTNTSNTTAAVHVGAGAQEIALNPAETEAYVSNVTANSISVVDVGSNTVSLTLSGGFGFNAPMGIAFAPNGVAYVANSGGNDVKIINASHALVGTVPVGSSPKAIAVRPDGNVAYVANSVGDSVSVIDTNPSSGTYHSVIQTITGFQQPSGITFSADGSTAYVTNYSSDSVTVVDVASGAAIGSPIAVGDGPLGVAVNAGASRLYVANNLGGTLSVVDLATDAVSNTVVGLPEAYDVLLSPDEARAYVSSPPTSSIDEIDTGIRSSCSYAHAWPGGNGTTSDPYRIASQSDLDAMRHCLESAFKLTRDIQLSGEWTPIGTETSAFSGSLDGDGHTVSGLRMSSASLATDDVVGLFGALEIASVSNLTVSNVEITGDVSTVGAIAGLASESFISDVRASGTINVTGGAVGGLIGNFGTGSMTNARSEVTVTGDDQVGGAVGLNVGAAMSDITATGNVTGTERVGGLIGIGQVDARVLRSSATGRVTGTAFIGGLMGLLGNFLYAPTPGGEGWIRQSFATGDVVGTPTTYSYAGGLVGLLFQEVEVSNSYATGSVTGSRGVGSLFGWYLNFTPIVSTSYGSGALTSSSAPDFIGGAIGGRSYSASATDVYWDSDTTGTTFGVGTSAGGENIDGAVGLTSEQMRFSENFAGFDFTNVWGYDCARSKRPVLRWAYPEATLTFCQAPGTPGKPSAVAKSGSAEVSVVAPTTGGAPTSYTVTSSPGAKTCTVTVPATSCVVKSLAVGETYTFTSRASNATGESAESAASDGVVPLKYKNTAVNEPKYAKKRDIARPGRSVLLPRGVLTTSGELATARVRFATNERGLRPVGDVRPAHVRANRYKVTPSGRVIAWVYSKKPVTIVLTLRVPASTEYTAYRSSKTWVLK